MDLDLKLDLDVVQTRLRIYCGYHENKGRMLCVF